jgi:peptide-methionine (R)-S-oxide reductase
VRRIATALGLATASALAGCDRTAYPPKDSDMAKKNAPPADASKPAEVAKTDAEWRRLLTPEQYHVMREKGTERAFTGKYWKNLDDGTYHCAACGAVLFQSQHKFVSECGWPAFDKPEKGAIEEHHDSTYGMDRTEVVCAHCGAHLGHVFDDGPTSTGLRYCINSVSIDLEKAKADGEKKQPATGTTRSAAPPPPGPSTGSPTPSTPAMDTPAR